MFSWAFCYVFLSVHIIVAIPNVNLFNTDRANEDNHTFPHTCLYMTFDVISREKYYERARFCLDRPPSTYKNIKLQSSDKITFAELAKQGITSEQLYFWSASIDLIEQYQFYLNQLSTNNEDLSLAQVEFYNCTSSRFGPYCQYEFLFDISYYSSFAESILIYYQNMFNGPFMLTCYAHLTCNLGSPSLCLDWREICDGKIDCIDNGIDEDQCWQLEISECEENEIRCRNAQCIPDIFSQDSFDLPDCIDVSDEPGSTLLTGIVCDIKDGPWSKCEDTLAAGFSRTHDHIEIRTNLFVRTVYSIEDLSQTENCSKALLCLLDVPHLNYQPCDENTSYIEIIENSCTELIFFPMIPVLYGHIYFVYKTNEIRDWLNISSIVPFYICSNQSTANNPFWNSSSKSIVNKMSCIHLSSLVDLNSFIHYSTNYLHKYVVTLLKLQLQQYHLPFEYNSNICNRSNMYQCLNSTKCISMSRLLDHFKDCPMMDDEDKERIRTNDVIKYVEKNFYNCTNGNYINAFFLSDDNCDCEYIEEGWCPDENTDITYLKTNLIFQHICDGFVDMNVILIENRNESDETDCQQWRCDNIYTHCDEIWNCPNGVDEAFCNSTNPLNCPTKWHTCVSPQTNELTCLSLDQLGDGIVDCLGATDEPNLCETRIQFTSVIRGRVVPFYCRNSTNRICLQTQNLCNGYNDCPYNDDEQFCMKDQIDLGSSRCSWQYSANTTEVEQFLCDFPKVERRWETIHFRMSEIVEHADEIHTPTMSLSIKQSMNAFRYRYCNRGIDIDVWFDHNSSQSTTACLCPSNYYGELCQYQSQRISLSLKFQTLAGSSRTLFAIVISLIDNSEQRLVHSYEQLTYVAIRDCQFKFTQYLLYSTQPNDRTKNYSIHIDFYEKISLKYRGSALLPVRYPFLPVNRLVSIVNIPRIDQDKLRSCSISRCDHGQCMIYSNQPNDITFCRCHKGWSGKYCHIPHKCDCFVDSLCAGISADNRSICVCPMNRFGTRCLLIDTVCEKQTNSTCKNHGLCVPNHHLMSYFQNFSCICPKNFAGDQCEIADTQLILTFDNDLILPHLIFVHFIELTDWYQTREYVSRATTYRLVPFRQNSLTVYWSERFHLAFTELSNKNYYLTVVQDFYNQSVIISRHIRSSDRCPNISEIFNETFLQWPNIRQVKYYHLPCQNLSCFHDDIHLCICYEFNQQRLANCFRFDHYMKLNCFGRSECENGGACLQNKLHCSTKSWCLCPSCYYGQLCQFSTSGFHLSLDGILGYHILPDVNLNKQQFIVKMSFTLTIIFFIFGLIDGILCLITFKNRKTHEIGCGYYLLFSSIATLLTICMFKLKYLILLLTQMSIITNGRFIEMQCYSFDFLLQICMSTHQWLSACIAIERTMMIIKGIDFNKIYSVKAAKSVCPILVILIICSYIHDPIYRNIIQEDNDIDDTKRTWCIVSYPAGLRIYNYFIHAFHVFGPFLINLGSVPILLKKKTEQTLIIHSHRIFKQLLFEHMREFKHLLIGPIVLVLLILPRLITTFLSTCMQSTDDAWIFLIGYLFSFIPCMVNFIIFVLPSQFYRKQFLEIIQR